MDIRSAGPARTRACEQGVQVPLREDLVKTVPGGNMLLNSQSVDSGKSGADALRQLPSQIIPYSVLSNYT